MTKALKYVLFTLVTLGYLLIQVLHGVEKPLDQALSLWTSGIIGIILGAFGYYLFGGSEK